MDPRTSQPWAFGPSLLRRDFAWVGTVCFGHAKWDRLSSLSAVARGYRCKAHLVGVQQGVADDVLTDVGRWSQAVQAVEQLHTGDVMLSGLLVQLIPEHTSHPLREKELTPMPILLVRAWS